MSSLNKRSTSNKHHKKQRLIAGGVSMLLALVLAACASATPTADMPAPADTPVAEVMVNPSVTVIDQAIVDGKVTIARS
jgi:uncharacterized lipoprotein YbaY